MFEATPFAVAMSPVVRVADPPGPRNDSAAKVAMVRVLTPGPVAMENGVRWDREPIRY
jgi:hypothetical protein